MRNSRIINLPKPEEIEQLSFKPQVELEALTQEKSTEAHQMRFEHFDEEAREYLRFFMESTKKQLDDVSRVFLA
ncbi:hypothetical protein HNQ69_001207 [Bartonella callosciuri]|uniref:Uncharacterized protein n=1 Tax=Bartonella callosciuri TaxID=686223 RepID=A0A840NVW9_9HYPH|nr:hypothetical protein [Bartonella callosciuri]MBB5074073.1 hypothetical protein [Bartonella callosciuri]